jgi:hypothetical protein
LPLPRLPTIIGADSLSQLVGDHAGHRNWQLRDGEQVIACNASLLGRKHFLIGIARFAMKRLFSETPGQRRANVLCEYRTSPRRRHASSKERLAVLMLYVHTLHDFESLQRLFAKGN